MLHFRDLEGPWLLNFNLETELLSWLDIEERLHGHHELTHRLWVHS